MTKEDKPQKKKRSLKKSDSNIEDLTDSLQRVQADFVNYKRRAEEDYMKAVSIGREATVKGLLPVFDTFERAIAHTPKDLVDNDFVKGVAGIAKQFESTLAQMGVERIEVLGKEFDPETMEAISVEDGDGEHEVVVEELQPGYKHGDTIIRHAMVKVGKE